MRVCSSLGTHGPGRMRRSSTESAEHEQRAEAVLSAHVHFGQKNRRGPQLRPARSVECMHAGLRADDTLFLEYVITNECSWAARDRACVSTQQRRRLGSDGAARGETRTCRACA